jgi:hypothetical protein
MNYLSKEQLEKLPTHRLLAYKQMFKASVTKSKSSITGEDTIIHNYAPGTTAVYDEAGLRLTIAEYLSDESRARFADDGRFMDKEMFFRELDRLIELFQHFR